MQASNRQMLAFKINRICMETKVCRASINLIRSKSVLIMLLAAQARLAFITKANNTIKTSKSWFRTARARKRGALTLKVSMSAHNRRKPNRFWLKQGSSRQITEPVITKGLCHLASTITLSRHNSRLLRIRKHSRSIWIRFSHRWIWIGRVAQTTILRISRVQSAVQEEEAKLTHTIENYIVKAQLELLGAADWEVATPRDLAPTIRIISLLNHY